LSTTGNIKAGELDRRITIKQPGTTRDPDGGLAEGFTTVATVWAKMDNRPGGKEQYTADKEISVSRTVWTIWHRSDVTTKMIIEYDSKEYDIIRISEIGRKSGLEILTELRQ